MESRLNQTLPVKPSGASANMVFPKESRMGSKTIVVKAIVPTFFLLLLLLLFYHFSPPQKSDITIRLHEDQIDIQKLNNAIVAFIIEKGYGYQVKKVESTIKEIHDHLVTGDIDVTLEMWKENNLAWHDKALNGGSIEDLGILYSGGRQYWIIPRWYAVEKQIKTVFDMEKHWRDFTDPEDPSKGIFFNCIFGWACRDLNRIKLEGYGLDRYYNTVSPTSPEALKAIYESAGIRKIPVFGYYWEPNAIMTGDDWYILEEPPHSETVWARIIEAAATPGSPPLNEACAIKSSAVHKLAHRNLRKKAPDVVSMLEKLTVDIDIFNDILFSRDKNSPENKPFETFALLFLNTEPNQWHQWVTPEARMKIEAALSAVEVPGSGK